MGGPFRPTVLQLIAAVRVGVSDRAKLSDLAGKLRIFHMPRFEIRFFSAAAGNDGLTADSSSSHFTGSQASSGFGLRLPSDAPVSRPMLPSGTSNCEMKAGTRIGEGNRSLLVMTSPERFSVTSNWIRIIK